MESITGYSIINAESFNEAENIARDNPFIASVRVYEIREHWESRHSNLNSIRSL